MRVVFMISAAVVHFSAIFAADHGDVSIGLGQTSRSGTAHKIFKGGATCFAHS